MYYIEKENAPTSPYPFNIVRWAFEEASSDTVCFNMHNHEALEVIVVLEGELSVTCAEEKYTLGVGDSIMINPFELHSEICGKGVTYLCLTANMRKVTDFAQLSCIVGSGLVCGEYGFCTFCPSGSDAAKANFQCLTGLYEKFSRPGTAEAFFCYGAFMEYLGKLSAFLEKRTATCGGRYDMDFMRKVALYLSENYTCDIGTPDICNALHYEISCFCHKFRKNFGMCFSNYLCMYRINAARENYINSGLPVSIIAEKCGFADYNYFSRCFKKYTGVSPKQYFGKK